MIITPLFMRNKIKMGLDTTLYKQTRKPKIEQIFDKLDETETEMEEVLYWRKNYNLLEWFRENLCEIDNCIFHEVSKKVFEKWLHALENDILEYSWDEKSIELNRDIEIITKILKETDFKKVKFFFYNWW